MRRTSNRLVKTCVPSNELSAAGFATHQAATAQAKLSSSKRTLALEQGWQPEKAMHRPFSDRFAKAQTMFFRFIADRFLRNAMATEQWFWRP